MSDLHARCNSLYQHRCSSWAEALGASPTGDMSGPDLEMCDTYEIEFVTLLKACMHIYKVPTWLYALLILWELCRCYCCTARLFATIVLQACPGHVERNARDTPMWLYCKDTRACAASSAANPPSNCEARVPCCQWRAMATNAVTTAALNPCTALCS